MNSKTKGDLAVIEAIRIFTHLGYQVMLPIGDRQKYDMVVDTGEKLLKIQCKFTSRRFGSGRYMVHVFVGGGNRSSGNVKIPYKNGDFDAIFIMTDNGDTFLIPSEEFLKKKDSIGMEEKFRVVFSLADCKSVVEKQDESKTNGENPSQPTTFG